MEEEKIIRLIHAKKNFLIYFERKLKKKSCQLRLNLTTTTWMDGSWWARELGLNQDLFTDYVHARGGNF